MRNGGPERAGSGPSRRELIGRPRCAVLLPHGAAPRVWSRLLRSALPHFACGPSPVASREPSWIGTYSWRSSATVTEAATGDAGTRHGTPRPPSRCRGRDPGRAGRPHEGRPGRVACRRGSDGPGRGGPAPLDACPGRRRAPTPSALRCAAEGTRCRGGRGHGRVGRGDHREGHGGRLWRFARRFEDEGDGGALGHPAGQEGRAGGGVRGHPFCGVKGPMAVVPRAGGPFRPTASAGRSGRRRPVR